MSTAFENRNSQITIPGIVLILMTIIVCTESFSVTQVPLRHSRDVERCKHHIGRFSHPVLFSSTKGNEEQLYAESEIEMGNMILSISKEKDDEKRRSTIISLMKEKIQADDPVEAAKFVQLWDRTLTAVGGKFQDEAREKALKMASETIYSKDEDQIEDGTTRTKEKSDDELQLWALIDMMIQSKILIKKASES
jgi:hypothetical protein